MMNYNNKQANRRANKRANNQFPISHFKCIPHNWLSVIESGIPLTIPAQNPFYFIPMKTPLPEFLTKSLKQVSPWTPAKAITNAKNLLRINTNFHFLAINVSQSNEMVLEEDWKDVGASYARCPVSKSFEQNSIDTFCDIINKELTKINNNEALVCLVYSGCGHNRVGFCITSYLTRTCNVELSDALKRVDKSSPRLIHKQDPLDRLSTVFKTSPQIHGPPPEGVRQDEDIPEIGKTNLPFEKYNGLKKISKNILHKEEKLKVLSILAKACNDQSILDGYFPVIEKKYWSEESFTDLQNEEYLMTFEPRGLRCFVVVNAESQVFLVVPVLNINANYSNYNIASSNMNTRCRTEVHELKAKSNLKPNPTAVAVAYLIEEKKRAVIMTTDLLYIYDSSVVSMRLHDRLGLLFSRLNKYLKPDYNLINNAANTNATDQQAQQQQQQQVQQQYQVFFMFRPMTPLIYARKLYKDLSSFFVNCDGISFSPVNHEPLSSIYMPVNPSVILLFDYNGNDKAILYARYDEKISDGNGEPTPISERTYPLKPISILSTAKNPKLIALDRRTSRFELDKKKEWQPTTIGHNDPPTTTSELKSLNKFLKTNPSYENILKEVETIASQSPAYQTDFTRTDE